MKYWWQLAEIIALPQEKSLLNCCGYGLPCLLDLVMCSAVTRVMARVRVITLTLIG